jgi:uncharacterized protein YbjT (DUF2867 family)
MSQKKIIVVFGATGTQGGGLAHAILNDPNSEFTVRAITRDTTSDKAKELASLGAEVVAADIDNIASIKKALEGAYGAYFVTFYWAHFSPEKEDEQFRNMAEAAKDAGLKHIVVSTLEDTREFVPLHDDRMPTLMEKYKVPHFDAKGAAKKYFTDLKLPVTFFHISFYWDNLIYFGSGPKPGADDKLAITFPIGDKPMSGIGAADIGKCAYGIFKKGTSLVGKTIGVAGEHLTGYEMAAALSKALGKEVVYNKVPAAVYRGFGFPGADDLANMFQFYEEFADELMDVRDVEYSKELNPGLQNFEEWLKDNAKLIPLD